jgi:hypothetical protein
MHSLGARPCPRRTFVCRGAATDIAPLGSSGPTPVHEQTAAEEIATIA